MDRDLRLRRLHIVGCADKRKTDVVDAVFDAEANVVAILVTEDGKPEQARRDVHALPCAQGPSDQDATTDLVVGDFARLELDRPIRE